MSPPSLGSKNILSKDQHEAGGEQNSSRAGSEGDIFIRNVD
jgi:hypothetical protein